MSVGANQNKTQSKASRIVPSALQRSKLFGLSFNGSSKMDKKKCKVCGKTYSKEFKHCPDCSLREAASELSGKLNKAKIRIF